MWFQNLEIFCVINIISYSCAHPGTIKKWSSANWTLVILYYDFWDNCFCLLLKRLSMHSYLSKCGHGFCRQKNNTFLIKDIIKTNVTKNPIKYRHNFMKRCGAEFNTLPSNALISINEQLQIYLMGK